MKAVQAKYPKSGEARRRNIFLPALYASAPLFWLIFRTRRLGITPSRVSPATIVPTLFDSRDRRSEGIKSWLHGASASIPKHETATGSSAIATSTRIHDGLCDRLLT